jgi:hypothetical protein
MKQMVGKRDDSCRVVVDIVRFVFLGAVVMLKIINGTCYRESITPDGYFERRKMYYSIQEDPVICRFPSGFTIELES